MLDLLQEATEEELERLLDKIMVLFRFIHGEYSFVSVFLQLAVCPESVDVPVI